MEVFDSRSLYCGLKVAVAAQAELDTVEREETAFLPENCWGKCCAYRKECPEATACFEKTHMYLFDPIHPQSGTRTAWQGAWQLS